MLVLLAVTLVAITLVATIETSAVAAPSPRAQLHEAATGSWAGDFGTAEFRPDGTATLDVRACGFTPLRPGFVQAFTDCAPDLASGKVRIATGGYVLEQADGTTLDYAAYVDAGRLHLGPGSVVTQLSRRRRGTVDIGGGTRLHVGDGTCRYTQPFAPKVFERPCRFVRRGGRTVLLFTAPDPFAGGKVDQQGLVYLAGSRLLVSPELVERVFARTAT